MSVTPFSVEIDWTASGSWVNESNYVVALRGRLGFETPADITAFVAQPGWCEIKLKNSTGRFTPGNVASALSPYVRSRRPVRIRATDSAGTHPVWFGYIESITPDMGSQSRRECTILAVDALHILNTVRASMDLQHTLRADQVIAGAVNIAFGAPAAAATLTFTANPAALSSVTINLQAYTFVAALSPAAYEVLIGATKEATAANLCAAINADAGAGTSYGGSTGQLPGILADVTSNVISLTATLPGTIGNSYPLTTTSGAITLSGATFAGGLDYPSGLVNYQTSSETFDTIGDRWIESRNACADIVRDGAQSDQGKAFVQTDGTVTFWTRDSLFAPLVSLLSLDGTRKFSALVPTDVGRVYNEVNVTIIPRSTLGTVGVLAQIVQPVTIPPRQSDGSPGTRTLHLPFHDDFGNPCGGTNLQLPLVAHTDYAVNDRANGTGFDYTVSPSFSFGPIRPKGSQVEIVLKNTASGPLYVTLLQVQGQAVTIYDPLTQTFADAASQADLGKRSLDMPLPLSADDVLAVALGEYLLDRYKDDAIDVSRIDIENESLVGATSIFSVPLMGCITVSDTQAGVSALVCRVMGLDFEASARGYRLGWRTVRADDSRYWNLGVAGYTELDVTTRLGI
jgi:hypothetical protein